MWTVSSKNQIVFRFLLISFVNEQKRYPKISAFEAPQYLNHSKEVDKIKLLYYLHAVNIFSLSSVVQIENLTGPQVALRYSLPTTGLHKGIWSGQPAVKCT